MDKLGIDKAHIAGTSTGGCVLQNLAIDHPDRLRCCIFSNTWVKADEFITRVQMTRRRIALSYGAEEYVKVSSLFTSGAMQFRYDLDKVLDLRGKRVGVPDYVMTAALWFRVFLRELHGIGPREVSWYIGRTKDLSHGGLLNADTEPPPEVPMTWLDASQTFDVMLDRGEIDIAYGFAPRHDPKLFSLNIDRYGGTPLEGNPRIGKLFTDGGCAVVKAFFQKTGIVPANHVIVAQRRLLEEHPWLGAEVLELFTRSKQIAYERNNFGAPAYLYFGAMNRAEQAALYGHDPFPFGIEKNRHMLETLFRSSHEQGLTRRLARIDDVFHHSLLDT